MITSFYLCGALQAFILTEEADTDDVMLNITLVMQLLIAAFNLLLSLYAKHKQQQRSLKHVCGINVVLSDTSTDFLNSNKSKHCVKIYSTQLT